MALTSGAKRILALTIAGTMIAGMIPFNVLGADDNSDRQNNLNGSQTNKLSISKKYGYSRISMKNNKAKTDFLGRGPIYKVDSSEKSQIMKDNMTYINLEPDTDYEWDYDLAYTKKDFYLIVDNTEKINTLKKLMKESEKDLLTISFVSGTNGGDPESNAQGENTREVIEFSDAYICISDNDKTVIKVIADSEETANKLLENKFSEVAVAISDKEDAEKVIIKSSEENTIKISNINRIGEKSIAASGDLEDAEENKIFCEKMYFPKQSNINENAAVNYEIKAKEIKAGDTSVYQYEIESEYKPESGIIFTVDSESEKLYTRDNLTVKFTSSDFKTKVYAKKTTIDEKGEEKESEKALDSQQYRISDNTIKLVFKPVLIDNDTSIELPEEIFTGIENGRPKFNGLKVMTTDSEKILNIFSLGLFSNSKLTLIPDITDEGQKSFDSVRINGIRASVDESGKYYINVEKESCIDKVLNVELGYLGKTVLSEKVYRFVSNEQAYEMDPSTKKYYTIVSEGIPGISVNDNNVLGNNFKVGFSVFDVDSDNNGSDQNIIHSGLRNFELKIYKGDSTDNESDVIAKYTKSGDRSLTTEIKGDGITLSNSSDNAYSNAIVGEEKYELSVNDPGVENKLPDGKYTAKLTVENNAGNKKHETFSFTADSSAPVVTAEVSGLDGKIAEDEIYKDGVKLSVKINDSNLSQKVLERAAKAITLTRNDEPVNENITFEEGENPDEYVFSKIIKDEGRYSFKIDRFEDDSNNFSSAVEKSFILDNSAPVITVKYDDNVQKNFGNGSSFGFFTSEEVIVDVNVEDDYSGVNKDSIVVKNGDTDLSDKFDFEETEKGYKARYVLDKEIAYKLIISAKDMVDRNAILIVSPENIANNTITSTEARPSAVTFTDVDIFNNDKNDDTEYKVFNKNVNINFTAKAMDEGKANPGIRSVEVQLYKYKEDADKFVSLKNYHQIDSIGSEENKYLKRNTNIGKSFSDEAVESCDYTYSLYVENPENANYNLLRSGRYKMDVKVTNNVVDKNGKYVTTRIESKEFAIDVDKPEFECKIVGSDGQKTSELKHNTDENITVVYDGAVKIKLSAGDNRAIQDVNNNISHSLKKITPDGEEENIDIGNLIWTKNSADGKYEAEIDLGDEAFYYYSFNSLSDDQGNINENPDTLDFAIDNTQPEVDIEYNFGSILDHLLSTLTFGLYSGNSVSATVTIKDMVAGVDSNKISITNGANNNVQVRPENIEVSDGNGDPNNKDGIYAYDVKRYCKITFELEEEQAYKLKATASDMLHRNDGDNSETVKATDGKNVNDNVIIKNNEERIDKEVISTKAEPVINISSNDDGVSFVNKSSQNVKVDFTASSRQSDSNTADPGLNSVKVEVFYAETKEKYINNDWGNAAFTLTDNGNTDSTTSGMIKLDRISNVGVSYQKKKISSTNYRISIDTNSNLDKNKSGYYKFVVTSFNNVISENAESFGLNSSKQQEKVICLDYIAPEIVVNYDWVENKDTNRSEVAGNKTYYNADRKITVTVTEENYSIEEIEKIFENVITKKDIVSDKVTEKNSLKWTESGNKTFTGTYTFTDDLTDSNDGKYDILIPKFTDKSGNSAVNTDGSNFENHTSSFIIDKTSPVIEISYGWAKENGSNKTATVNQTVFYDSDRLLTVKVVENNFDIEKVKSVFENVISEINIVKGDVIGKKSLSWSIGENNTFIGTYIFTDNDNAVDGRYIISIPEFTDYVNNNALNRDSSVFTGDSNDFIIDETNPRIAINYSFATDSNDNKSSTANDITFFNADRKITVEVIENNFDQDKIKDLFKDIIEEHNIVNGDLIEKYSLEWSVSADNKFIGTFTFTDGEDPCDGRYAVHIPEFVDYVGNKSVNNSNESAFNGSNSEFIIDETAPVISVNYSWENSNASNKQTSAYDDTYYNAERRITISVTENNFDQDKIEALFADIIEEQNIVSGEVIKKHSLEWNVRGDNKFIGTFTFTDGENPYDGKFKVNVPMFEDHVSNIAQNVDGTEFTGDVQSFIIDKTMPVISVNYGWSGNIGRENTVDGKTYFSADRKLTIMVTERNFKIDHVKKLFADIITDEAGEKYSLNWIKNSNNVFVGTFVFTDDPEKQYDGKYSISVPSFKDHADNSAVLDNDQKFTGNKATFIIDKTAPVITWKYSWKTNNSNNNTYKANGNVYYNANRVLTVTVVEHNFNTDRLKDIFKEFITDENKKKLSASWRYVTGNTFEGTFVFEDKANNPNDGKYEVKCNGFTDYAGNNALENNSKFTGKNDLFIIDTTKPVINVSYSNLGRKEPSHNGYDYYNTDKIIVTIDVTEHNFNAIADSFANKNIAQYTMLDISGRELETIKLDNSSLRWTTPGNDSNVHRAVISIPTGSRYKNFYFDTYDFANNLQSYRNDQKFVIDNRSPEGLDYSYDRDSIQKFFEIVTIGAYKSDVRVTLKAKDRIAGIRSIEYTYVGISGSATLHGSRGFENDGAASEYREYSFVVSPNFKGYITFKVTDFCGNVTEFNAKTEKAPSGATSGIVVDDRDPRVDTIAPVIKLNPTGTPRNNIFSSDVRVNVEVNDPLAAGVTSGVNRIEYYIVNNTTKARYPAVNYQAIYNDADKKSSNFKTSFDIDCKTFNSNNVEIVVKAYDNAGNFSESKKIISIDITAPKISITYDNNQANKVNSTEYYKANRTATITVTERNFDPKDVVYSIKNTDGTIPSISGWTENKSDGDPDKWTHTAKIVYSADGDYTFDFSFKDMAGNSANKIDTHKFTIDKTIPKISVTYDNNSAQNTNYYNKHRKATIQITEHNFSWDSFEISFDVKGSDNVTSASAPQVVKEISSGNVHIATVIFDHDGLFSYNVKYKDLALNNAVPFDSGKFYIDTEKPKIDIQGIETGKAYDDAVDFKALITEINYKGECNYSLIRSDDPRKDYSDVFGISKNNDSKEITCPSPSKDKKNDGIYTFTITAKDMAGNDETVNVKFSVNRFGSTYEFADKSSTDLSGKCVNNVQDIRIREVNVDMFDLDEIIVVRGSDNKIFSSKGTADNRLVCDEPEVEETSNGWYSVVYCIKASNFTEDGPYTIKVKSTDKKLGKTNSNDDKDLSTEKEEPKMLMSFVYDATKPLVSISGVEGGILYEEASKTITINCDDFNLKDDTLTIKIGDKELKVDKENIELTDSGIKVKLDINSSEYKDYIDVLVSICDKAGNIGEAKIEHFKLSATIVERFFANTPLVIGVFGAFALIILVVIVIIVARKKKAKS